MTAIPAGHWIAASRLLGRLIPAGDDYPHVCGFGRLWRRDCAACARDKDDHARQAEPGATNRDAQTRRTGE